MSTMLHDIGEEFERKHIFHGVAKPASVNVGLYHDGEVSGDTSNGDDLTDASTLSDIQTEPSDGNYGRQSVSLDSSGFDVAQDTNGDWYASVASDVTFDVGSTTGTVDAYFVTVVWDRNQDGTSSTYLYFTGNLTETADLSNYTTLNVGSVGLGQT